MTIRFLIIVSLLLALFLVGLPALANTTSLEVVGSTTLVKENSPYFFTGIHVAAGAELTIDPGVEIVLAKGAAVGIDGTISSEGTSDQPIMLTGQGIDRMWSRLTVAANSKPSTFIYTTFRYFAEPIEVDALQTVLNHDTFVDGTRNLLVVKDGQSMPSVHYEDLIFTNQSLGSDMQDNGMLFQGSFHDIHLHNIFLQDARMVSHIYILGIRALGDVSTLEADAVWFATCPSTIHNDVQHKQIDVVLNQTHCSWRNIPVVFVPGYGTSIDLQKLAHPEDRAVGGNWHFLSSLTPAYTKFLADLTRNQISFEVAYYDWRLPTEDIVRGYLMPIIAKAKAETGSNQVYLVAHSFGGLVARAYVQGDQYQQDVAQLVELGTPNLGSAKIYSVWEAGILPDDWGALNNILLWYEWLERNHSYSRVTLIRTFFPSAQDLLPIYPAIYFQGSALLPDQALYPNTMLLGLAKNLGNLSERTNTTLVFSQSEPTLTRLAVKSSPNPLASTWADGEPIELPAPLDGFGDGTVPEESAHLSSLPSIEVKGEHSLLPAIASGQVISLLYPQLGFHASQSQSTPTHWFVFDCPISVTVTLPDGRQRSSATQNGSAEVGEVEESDQLLWMFMPDEDGDYHIQIQAKTDTEARFWVDHEAIQSKLLTSGEEWNVSYSVHSSALLDSVLKPFPSAESSPAILSMSTPQPLHTQRNVVPTTLPASSVEPKTRSSSTNINLETTKTSQKTKGVLGVYFGLALLILWGNRRE